MCSVGISSAPPQLARSKDDNLLKGNFRPVSILTSISKIYENVVNNQLLGHFYEIFNDLLSAFRKGHSCQLSLLKFVEDMKNALDQKHAVSALFMDLSKAFDCLPHGLLVAKLHAYGLTPAACCLLDDDVTTWRQVDVLVMEKRNIFAKPRKLLTKTSQKESG